MKNWSYPFDPFDEIERSTVIAVRIAAPMIVPR
jgi:hypothetical protein